MFVSLLAPTKETAPISLACGSPRETHKHGVVTNSYPTYRTSNKGRFFSVFIRFARLRCNGF